MTAEIFRYEGDFAAVRIDWLTSEVRRRMEAAPVAPKARARLFASFVEMAQNIIQYAAPARGQQGPRRGGAVAFGRDGDGYWVASTNRVAGVHAARLRERLERIRAMGPAEVRAAYQARLAEGLGRAADPLSRGAGLGLLSIARAAGGGLSYRLEDAEGEPFTFSLRATVTANGEPR